MNHSESLDFNSSSEENLGISDCQQLRISHQARLEWDHLMATVALRIRQALDLEEILQTTTDEVQKLLGCDRVLIYQLNSRTVSVEKVADPQWSLVGCQIQDQCFTPPIHFHDDHQFSAIADLSTADLIPCYRQFLERLQVQAKLAIPLFKGPQLWGLLIAHHCRHPRPWETAEIQGLQQIAIQVGIAINQAALIAELQQAKQELETEVAQRTSELAQANAQLSQQNQALQNALVGVSQLDRAGYYQQVNPAYAQICGYDPQDLIGQLWTKTVHPDDLPYLEAQYHMMLETGKVEAEARGIRPDGSVFYKQVIMMADYDDQGEIIGHRCFMKDISARKQAEIALQNKTQELDHFFSVTADLFCIADAQGRFVRLNPQWEQTLGYPLAELEGAQFMDYVHPDDCQATIDAFGHLKNQEKVLNFTNRYRCQDGSYRWLEWCSVPMGDLIYAAVRDITDRQETKAQLQNLSTRLSLALEAGKIGTWDWDFSSNVTWDDRMYELFGLQDLGRKVLYEDWADLVHPDDRFSIATALQDALNGEQCFDIEFRVQRPDGVKLWIQSTALVQYNDQGEAVRMTGINYDITERKQAQLALQQSEAQYRTIIETTLEGVWVLDALDETSFANRQMATMLGYSIQEMIGTPYLEFIDPEHRSLAQNCLEDRHQGLSDQHRTKFRRQDGRGLWAMVSSTPLLDQQNQYNGCVKLVTDITPMVEMQKALQTSEAQLVGILNSSLDGIMAFQSLRDKGGEIIDFVWLLSNPMACELVKRSRHQLIGQRLLEVMPGNKTDGLFDAYRRVVTSGEPLRREFHYQQDGIDCWFEIVAVKLGDGFAVTFRNISNLRQSEKALQQINQQLEQRLQDLDQRNQEMLMLSDMSDFLQACQTVEEACLSSAHLVEPLFPNCSGGLFITCASRNRVENVAQWGKNLHSIPEFHPKDCWGLRRGRFYEVGVHRSGPRCSHIVDPEGLGITLCIPMVAQGETLGLFYLSSETPGALPDTKQQLARTVAEQLSLAIANLNLRETLQHQSIRDPLTGLFNRRYLEEAFNQEMLRAQRHQHPIGVIMLDIDHFKRFNDTYGHEAGDFVLKTVGEVLKHHVRGSDIACRYGGEEMTLVLPESSLENTKTRADTIRLAIEQLNLSHKGQHFENLSASLGVAAFPQHGTTAIAVIQAADAALYRAKAAGRNCVIVAP
ncbi:PAS domain S-box protein [Spirulina subsalsa FACHB-351]|uniref:PAS domain S-box protein n=1 Tax=Spirulina subsalsa FACHB-351 TaxID=234711 RepID=A0ABT3L977_9CYAN|nr:PAS domain S-box protein [Spirulina subsalsa]MCW6038068.1 PAS domain S-box protein [Spirulina subsalsa FACHB-351]